jgi:hypothetical protein
MVPDTLRLVVLVVLTCAPLIYGAVFCPSETPMRRLIAWMDAVAGIVRQIRRKPKETLLFRWDSVRCCSTDPRLCGADPCPKTSASQSLILNRRARLFHAHFQPLPAA